MSKPSHQDWQSLEAIEKFKADIPALVAKLRTQIDDSGVVNATFKAAQQAFLKLCQREINPDITAADIREMLIQHLLTSDIFTKIFGDAEFHQHNLIAAELEQLVGSLFSLSERRHLLHNIEHYYLAINATAAAMVDHHEKQKFLKVLYENFYQAYNPKAADRLGVVYTPNEIVQFMVRSVDYLLDKHFGKTLADRGVEILDPATGTGTFICEIIETAIPKQHLEDKFLNEIYANEAAILPYYIANLNIEYTFKQKMGRYVEFPNLCFVDTLDNVSALGYSNQVKDMFGLTSENWQRIKRQNEKRISVIIGNPPYNANQRNENENNKNREYPAIDKRIKETYLKHSTARKTKLYDMYTRFYRWASDRMDKNGVLAFITNRGFLDNRSFDGFRKCLQEEFAYGYIIDLQGNIRENYGNKGVAVGNVFDIQVGVAIMFLIKKEPAEGQCHLEYVALPNTWRKEEKLEWLTTTMFEAIPFERFTPDKNHHWLNLAEENGWDRLLPVCSKTKNEPTIFHLSSLGVNTARDGWVYDFDQNNLRNKIQFFMEKYNQSLVQNTWDDCIKWSRDLKRKFEQQKPVSFTEQLIMKANYRPFTTMFWYAGKILNDVLTQNHYEMFGEKLDQPNQLIGFRAGNRLEFCTIGTHLVPNLTTFSLDPARWLPLYRYDQAGNRLENITEWGLQQFRLHYSNQPDFQNLAGLGKLEIFHYVYAVLHNPAYRQKYELNLKREFPRIPFYPDFWQWVAWGKTLMELHLNYETVQKYLLQRQDLTGFENLSGLKVKLKANLPNGTIEIDQQTTLHGIPDLAWEYKLGHRSALEWILDQYKEKKPSDPTIAEHFDTYRFAKYKEQVIELLQRVCTVSVKTMEIVKQMAIGI